MKNNQYISGFSIMVVLIATCLLFLPVKLLPVNYSHEIDIGLPVSLDCPADISQPNDLGMCSSVVWYTIPGGCYVASGPNPGETHLVGDTTEVQINLNNNSDSCTFTITVFDNEPPEFTFCPEDIVKSYDDGICQHVYYDMPVAKDNCGVVSLTQVSGLSSGSIFPIGTSTENKFIAKDEKGNEKSCIFYVTIHDNHVAVLSTDGSSSMIIAPQGNLNYQRAFFLVTPDEMNESELLSGEAINTIGFTIGDEQSSINEGLLKVYLENTDDTISRIDTIWKTVTTTSNLYPLSGVAPGDYEWQVKTLCTDSSDYSPSLNFSTLDPNKCNIPYNLDTAEVEETTAIFNWESSATNFLVEYRVQTSNAWESHPVTGTTFSASGLTSATIYQWQVRSECSGTSSNFASMTFSTAGPVNCDAPTNFALGQINDTTAAVSWEKVDNATNYELNYRRKGTIQWFSMFCFSNSDTIKDLVAGTYYEWKVKVVCPDGSGPFKYGPYFNTTGDIVCYPPEGLKTKQIGNTGATLFWQDVPDASLYRIRYRLKESITWVNATDGMTLVSDSTITVPDTIGPYDIRFGNGNPFNYDGKGLYVAWEYLNSTGITNKGNTSLATRQNTSIEGENGLDSLQFILSFVGKTDENSSAQPLTLQATRLRPEIRLGSEALQDSVEVTAIYTLGHVAIPYGLPVPVSAMIKNFSDKPKTYTVTLDVYDAETQDNKLSIPQVLTVPAACGELITYTDWIPEETGIDSLVISIPAEIDENVLDNNSSYYLQNVNRVMHSYADESPVIKGAGFDSGDGLILSHFSLNGCGQINGVKIYLHHSAANNPLYAVVLDAAGNELDRSVQVTLDSSEVNQYYSFYFPKTPLIIGADYYVGLAQISNSVEGYFPVGVQWESNIIREGAYYRADLDGSNIVDHPYPGRLMIQVEILPGMPVPIIKGNEILCIDSTATLMAASKTIRFADAVISVSSEYSSSSFGARQVLGSPDVYPEYGYNPHAWIGNSATTSEREYIELHFPDTARINYIEIYQTLHPGAIDTVYAIDSAGNYYKLYSDSARIEPQEARIKEISFDLTSYRVSAIRIELHSDSVQRGIDAVAIGREDNPGDFDTFTWYPDGETTESIDITQGGQYALTVSNAGSCTLSDSILVETPPAIIAPTISLSGLADFCQGNSVTLYSSESEGNTWSTGEKGDSITVDTSGTYYVTYDNGCETATSANVVVTVYDLPEVIITGGPICPGDSTLIHAGDEYTSYLWKKGDDTLASTTAGIYVKNPDVYTVVVTDVHGCEGNASIATFFAPSPSPSISGDPNFCPGDSTLLDAGYGYSSYLWSSGETTRQIYVGTTGLVSVTVTNEYGCTGSTSVSVGEYTPPQPFISGALSLCFGSVTVLDAGEGYASYSWSTGEITSAIVVDTADTFTVTVTDAHGCKGSASATTNLDGAIPEVPGLITGPAGGVCQQNGLVYSIDPLLNTTHYVWTVPEGMTITAGQGTPQIIVDAGIVTTGIISVAASNTCGQSPTWNGRTMEVNGTPDVPGEIAGPANGVCGLSNLTYSIDVVYGASSYSWTVPVGAAITSGNGTSSITVSFDASFTTGYICVGTTNDCGTSEDACLLINSIPAMPAEIFGPIEVCRKEKNVAYSIDPIFNANTYNWTVPLQATIKSGQGTPDITVNFGNKSGYVTVQTENDCGLSSIQSLAVDVIKCTSDGLAINIIDPTNSDDPLLNGGKHVFFPEVIASAGGFSYGEVVTLSWTLGESVIETVNDDRMMLSQGFQQSYYEIIALGGIMEGSTFEVEVYPVPSRDNVHIHIISDSEPVNLLVELYDVVGTMLFKENVKSKEFIHQISLNQYPAKMFILKVIDVQRNYEQTFKIIKVKF